VFVTLPRVDLVTLGPMGAFLYGPVHGFMLWNVLLAAVPLVLAVGLFAFPVRTGVAWCVGFAIWVLFLPNAPYLLTDVVHMFHDIQRSPSDTWSYIVTATYGALFAFGLSSYAASLQLFRRFLPRVVGDRMVLPLVLVVHALCVTAMYAGRVVRLNSWDVFTAPGEVVSAFLRVPRPVTVVELTAMFVVVGAGVFATLAVMQKARARVTAHFR
jgi:uncharacterized membrane protein